MTLSRRFRVLALALAALALAGTGATAGRAAPSSPPLRVVTFNVLAPVWAAPVWYPEDMDMSLLDTEFRRARITAFLSSQAATTDVFCLQEVQESELPYFLAALGSRFTGFVSHNDRDWWSAWVVPEIPWAPNGTAIIVNRRSLSGSFSDRALSGDGNHAAFFEGIHIPTGQPVRVASIHLDSDFENNRVNEARSLVQQLPAESKTDVVCGDVNEDTENGSVGNILHSAGFTDVLAAVGNREPTHPWSSSYNTSHKWGIIDHVLVRNGLPVAGDVFDFGVWSIADEVPRIEANFRNTGSDHFPVTGTVGVGR
jgi:endonuclease/exonuclease/phosphatase family metal-dependent hydrolase